MLEYVVNGVVYSCKQQKCAGGDCVDTLDGVASPLLAAGNSHWRCKPCRADLKMKTLLKGIQIAVENQKDAGPAVVRFRAAGGGIKHTAFSMFARKG